jgi:FlaA1/EpsC-like NDP-sugar epimerase
LPAYERKSEIERMKINRYSIPEIIADIFLIAGAFALAFFIRFDFNIPSAQLETFKTFVIPLLIIKLIIFYFSGLYLKVWRYAGVRDFMTVLWASLLGTLAAIVIIFFIYRVAFPRSVVALDGFFTVALVGGARFARRGIRELHLKNLLRPIERRPILIVGAGDSGESILSEMIRRPELAYRPLGIIDDDAGKQGLIIHGVKVLGTRQQLKRLITKYKIEEVIISMPSASREVIRDIFFQCQEMGVKCKTLPGIYQIIDGTAMVSQIREIGVEDILGREPVKVDLKEAANYISAKPVLVTGAGGSIGSELCRQISRLQPASLIMIDQGESSLFEIQQELLNTEYGKLAIPVIADITDRNRITSVFEEYRPTVVFHTAAYKHVPMMEVNPIEAIKNNLFGTRTVAEIALQCGVDRFVSISTDKAVEPVSVMGISKALVEKLIQYLGQGSSTRFMIVRFGNVLDSSGSVVPIFKRQIAQGGPVTVTHPEMTRYFMTIPEAMQLVIQAGSMGEGGEVFVLDMGEQISILELAHNMIKLSGFEPGNDIPIEFSGIRPGERLHEKLFWDCEQALSTKHKKIKVVIEEKLDAGKFKEDMLELEKIVGSGNVQRMQGKLTELYQSYFHNNAT